MAYTWVFSLVGYFLCRIKKLTAVILRNRLVEGLVFGFKEE